MFAQGLLLAASLLLQAPGPATAAPSTISVQVTGSGRPLVLIPGFLSSGAVWDDVVEHYKDRWQCHVVTVKGFAGEAPVTGITLSRVRDDIVRYIRANKLQRPVIVGHSMGGVLALWIGAREPDIASAIISVDGVPFLAALQDPSATAGGVRAQAEAMKQLYAGMSPEQLAQATRLSLGMMMSDPKRIDEADAWALHSDPPTAAALLADLLTTDLRPEMSRIAAPVLLVPAVKAFAANALMKDSVLKAYEAQIAAVPDHSIVPADALHFVMYDDLPFLLRTMDAFLAAEVH